MFASDFCTYNGILCFMYDLIILMVVDKKLYIAWLCQLNPHQSAENNINSKNTKKSLIDF